MIGCEVHCGRTFSEEYRGPNAGLTCRNFSAFAAPQRECKRIMGIDPTSSDFECSRCLLPESPFELAYGWLDRKMLVIWPSH